jgi:hypothetical protein
MTGEKFLCLGDRDLDKLLLELILIYENYDFCEALLLVLLTTNMAES